jgi:hypothetical protein
VLHGFVILSSLKKSRLLLEELTGVLWHINPDSDSDSEKGFREKIEMAAIRR